MTESLPSDADRRPRAPVRSMTGFASGRIELPEGTITIDLRTVNSRHADLHFRLADELRDLEPALRRAISGAIARGKVECRLQWHGHDTGRTMIEPDPGIVESLLATERRILSSSPQAAPLSVAEILALAQAAAQVSLRNTSILQDGAATLWTQIESRVREVITLCIAAREREGARLAEAIARQVSSMRALVVELEPHLAAILEQSRERLRQRLAEAMPQAAGSISAEETFARIRQEVALVSLRGDVAEELERLRIHLDEVERLAATGGAIGKRIDFISQELNREANTLASKATGIAVTDAAVSLKLLIEQMREQVQNLE